MPFNEDRLHENHGRFEFYFNISRLADMLPFSRTANVLQQEKNCVFRLLQHSCNQLLEEVFCMSW